MQAYVQFVETLGHLLRASGADQDAAIKDALRWLCRQARVDRAILFQRGEAGSFFDTHHAQTSGTEPASRTAQVISDDEISRLEADWPVCLRHSDDMTTRAPEIAVLQRGFGSLAIAPMRQDGRLAGFVCFGVTDAHQVISEGKLRLLTAVTELIGLALARRAVEKQGIEATNLRPTQASTSSARLNSDGTSSSVSAVENSNPPITVIPIGDRQLPSPVNDSETGTMPATIATVVMTIGWARL